MIARPTATDHQIQLAKLTPTTVPDVSPADYPPAAQLETAQLLPPPYCPIPAASATSTTQSETENSCHHTMGLLRIANMCEQDHSTAELPQLHYSIENGEQAI